MTPESEQCKKFLEIKQQEAMIEAEIELALKKQELLRLQKEATELTQEVGDYEEN